MSSAINLRCAGRVFVEAAQCRAAVNVTETTRDVSEHPESGGNYTDKIADWYPRKYIAQTPHLFQAPSHSGRSNSEDEWFIG